MEDNTFTVFLMFVSLCLSVLLLISFMQSLPDIVKCIKNMKRKKPIEYVKTYIDVDSRHHQMKLRITADEIKNSPLANRYLLWAYIGRLYPDTLEGSWELEFPTATTTRLTKIAD